LHLQRPPHHYRIPVYHRGSRRGCLALWQVRAKQGDTMLSKDWSKPCRRSR
jgi:hypothetical protein